MFDLTSDYSNWLAKWTDVEQTSDLGLLGIQTQDHIKGLLDHMQPWHEPPGEKLKAVLQFNHAAEAWRLEVRRSNSGNALRLMHAMYSMVPENIFHLILKAALADVGLANPGLLHLCAHVCRHHLKYTGEERRNLAFILTYRLAKSAKDRSIENMFNWFLLDKLAHERQNQLRARPTDELVALTLDSSLYVGHRMTALWYMQNGSLKHDKLPNYSLVYGLQLAADMVKLHPSELHAAFTYNLPALIVGIMENIGYCGNYPSMIALPFLYELATTSGEIPKTFTVPMQTLYDAKDEVIPLACYTRNSKPGKIAIKTWISHGLFSSLNWKPTPAGGAATTYNVVSYLLDMEEGTKLCHTYDYQTARDCAAMCHAAWLSHLGLHEDSHEFATMITRQNLNFLNDIRQWVISGGYDNDVKLNTTHKKILKPLSMATIANKLAFADMFEEAEPLPTPAQLKSDLFEAGMQKIQMWLAAMQDQLNGNKAKADISLPCTLVGDEHILYRLFYVAMDLAKMVNMALTLGSNPPGSFPVVTKWSNFDVIVNPNNVEPIKVIIDPDKNIALVKYLKSCKAIGYDWGGLHFRQPLLDYTASLVFDLKLIPAAAQLVSDMAVFVKTYARLAKPHLSELMPSMKYYEHGQQTIELGFAYPTGPAVDTDMVLTINYDTMVDLLPGGDVHTVFKLFGLIIKDISKGVI